MTIQPSITGIDLGKNWFHVIGLDRDGAVGRVGNWRGNP
jgi:hypothetical protein